MVSDPIWEQVKKSVKRIGCQPRAQHGHPKASAGHLDPQPRDAQLKTTKPKWKVFDATPRLKSGLDYTPPAQSYLPPEQQPWWQALADKKQWLDAKLDLHGLTEAQAYQELDYFMRKAAARRWRYVLIITGKGKDLQGRLRGNLPKWLSSPPFHKQVQNFAHAHLKHGGYGAYYVALQSQNKNLTR